MTAPFDILPVELLAQIIELALGNPDEDFCRIGHNGIWSQPKRGALDLMLKQPSRPHTPLRDTLPFPDGLDHIWGDKSDTGMFDEWAADFHSVVKSLRLVNRLFNQIATPVLYRDISLLAKITSIPKLSKVLRTTLIPQAQHIRSIYIYANAEEVDMAEGQDECIAQALRSCLQLQSIGFYFTDTAHDHDWVAIQQAVLFLMEQGSLSCLGFYSETVLEKWVEYESFSGVEKLIRIISESQLARIQLKHLDLALASVSLLTYDQIRSRFPNLESFNVTNGSYRFPGAVWAPSEHHKWGSYKKLKRLQLYWCKNVYAPHVPELVKLFPALRELFVSACGDPSDNVIGPHSEKWHLDPNALCNTHIPLDYCHVEHMDGWEIRALGVIPAKTWVVTTIKPLQLIQELSSDHQLFPGMKRLQLAADSWPTTGKPASVVPLEELCTKRGVNLTWDANTIHYCTCCTTKWS
ncbi:hypothetical protein CPB86DRAFT_787271 [Serendipita vermifera]|nr:hypothetical protein CPB86DRAFT_787271 [Serendipita vermifera]